MGKPSKLLDEEWAELFRRDAAGETRRGLAAEFGVSVGTIKWQARKRSLRKGEVVGAVDKRRRPEGGWPGDHVHPQSRSGMTPRRWEELLIRRLAGEADGVLAAEYGVSAGRIAGKARDWSMRKKDRPEAVFLPRGPAALSPAEGGGGGRVGVAFDFDPADPEATEASLMARAEAAAAEGRASDFLVLRRLTRASRDLMRLRVEDGSPGRSHPSAAPTPSPSGEGEAAAPDPATWADPVLRGSQTAPEGEWTTWLFLGGRGAGKTLAGAMWLSDQAEALGPGGRLALIGPTLHDVREVMIEGASGVMALARWNDPKWGGRRPVFETSRRRLVFPNGATALAFSAEEPERLRGPQFSAAWADEFCAWKKGGETLALLRMGLRLPGARSPSPGRGGWRSEATTGGEGSASDPGMGDAVLSPPHPVACGDHPPPQGEGEAAVFPPRLMISTTPKPTAALRRLREEPGCVETHAGTRENAAHLSAGFVEGLERLYGGTKRAAQEIEGKVVESEGALFTAEMLARARVHPAGGYRPSGCLSPRTPGAPDPVGGEEVPDRFERVVVAVDPTATAGGNACGIVVAGRAEGAAWVLADLSVSGVRPDGWGRRVARAAESWKDAVVVAEVNQGGDMGQAVLKASGCAAKVREVRATKGKRVRAEPVAALYEQGRVRHAGVFDALEEELMALGCVDADGEAGTDRADALVWAITDLLVDGRSGERGPRISLLAAPPSSGLTGGAAEWPGHRSTTRALRGW